MRTCDLCGAKESGDVILASDGVGIISCLGECKNEPVLNGIDLCWIGKIFAAIFTVVGLVIYFSWRVFG